MKTNTGFYRCVQVDATGSGVVSHAGGVLLTDTVALSGIDAGLRSGLGRWRTPTAIYDPAKVLRDLALTLGLGGGLSGRHRVAAISAAAL